MKDSQTAQLEDTLDAFHTDVEKMEREFDLSALEEEYEHSWIGGVRVGASW